MPRERPQRAGVPAAALLLELVLVAARADGCADVIAATAVRGRAQADKGSAKATIAVKKDEQAAAQARPLASRSVVPSREVILRLISIVVTRE